MHHGWVGGSQANQLAQKPNARKRNISRRGIKGGEAWDARLKGAHSKAGASSAYEEGGSVTQLNGRRMKILRRLEESQICHDEIVYILGSLKISTLDCRPGVYGWQDTQNWVGRQQLIITWNAVKCAGRPGSPLHGRWWRRSTCRKKCRPCRAAPEW